MPTFTISVNNKVLGTYVVKKTVISIGRSRTNTISIASKAVSRNHVRIEFTPEGWTIVDLGSLNGTYVNNIRVNSAFLSEGDKVTVGAYAIAFSPEPMQSATPGETQVAAVQASEPDGTDTDVRLEGATAADAMAAQKEQTDVAEAHDIPPPPKTTSIPAQFAEEEIAAGFVSPQPVEPPQPATPRAPRPALKPSPTLSLEEKIKVAICENPLGDETWIRTRIAESDFGGEKVTKQDLQASLKEMDLDSNLKRYHYFMNS